MTVLAESKGATLNFLAKMEGIAQARAEVLKTMNIMIERKPEYSHGMTKEEVQKEHRFLVKKRVFTQKLSTYGNRMRDLYHPLGLAGRHIVHKRKHYYPISLHEQGKIDHSRCTECEIPSLENS